MTLDGLGVLIITLLVVVVLALWATSLTTRK
jgi:hypothetical protein